MPEGSSVSSTAPKLVLAPTSRPQASTEHVQAGKRMAPLDGLRAVSIILVLLGHLNGTLGFPETDFERFIGDYANLGVIVFFVISGFLITTLLIEEHDNYGGISLRLFYVRRFLRLMPAFLLFMAFIFLVQMAGYISLSPGDYLRALTYTVNFRRHNNWYVGHLWSLSVEEQFYLLWPAVLVLAGRSKATWIAAGVLLVSPIARFFAMGRAAGTIFPCVADSLACGCLLALCGDKLFAKKPYTTLIASGLFLPVAVILILASNWLRSYTVGVVLGVSVINLLIGLIVHRCVSRQSKMTSILSIRPLVAIGVLSYSLYLWQQFFLNRDSSWPICDFPLNLILTFVVASLSYFLVEGPINELRRKYRRAPL